MNQHDIVDCEPPGPISAPTRQAPAGTTDTHFHIFGPTDQYPLSPRRLYNPAFSPVSAYLEMARKVGIERMVIVQASIYGTDNRCMLDSIQAFGQDRARGIAVVDDTVTKGMLQEMHERGVRGIRFNAITGVTPLEWLPRIADLIAPLGWHVQLWIKADRLLQITPMLKDLPVDIVLDHMAQVPIELGMADPEVSNVLKLMETGRCWAKMVGYRISKAMPPYPDLDAFCRAIIQIAPGHCLWGTDWPHIYLEGRPMPDAGVLFDSLYRWCEPEVAKQILVDNPARLYGFGATQSV